MKQTFENLYKSNIEAFVKSFKKEPNEEDKEAIRRMTLVETALIKAGWQIAKAQ